jgi:hypothetical protein
MKTFQLAVLSLAFSSLMACGGSSGTSDGSDDDPSSNSGTQSATDVGVPASSATKDGLGVDHWNVANGNVTGYDSANKPAVSFEYQDTSVSADTTQSSVILKKGDQVTHWQYTVQTRATDGAYRVTDLKTDDAAGAGVSALKLLGADLSASTPPPGTLSTNSLHPLSPITTGGNLPLTAGCWNEEIVHANGHVYILTTTHGENGDWNTSVTCAR